MPDFTGLCTHVPHGVPQLPLCARAPLKRALGVSGDAFLVLAGGLLSAPKGVEHIVEALRRVSVSVPNVLLVVAGEPHPVFGRQYLQQLQALVADLGVDSLVQFRTKFAPQAELERLYQAADVFVCAHTSAEQTSSGTMLMAMAAGAPVVATPFAQAAELLADGTGVLVPFGNATAIADAVRHIFTHSYSSSRSNARRVFTQLIAIAGDDALSSRLRHAAYSRMAARAWPVVASRFADLALHPPAVPQSPAPRYERASSGDVDAEALTFGGDVYVEAGNGALVLSSVRNERWVNGVGPGWYPTDTFLSKRRPAWGVDSLLLNGCFMSYEPLTGKAFTRVLEDLRTQNSLLPALPGGAAGAGVAQVWEGPITGSGVTARVARRMRVLPGATEAVHLELDASVGGDVDLGASVWLTVGIDQLSSNPGVDWDSVTTHDSRDTHTVHAACSWGGDTLTRSRVRTFAVHGRRAVDGAVTALTIAVHSTPVEVHFTCNADRRLQYVHFDMSLHEADDAAATGAVMMAKARAELRWT